MNDVSDEVSQSGRSSRRRRRRYLLLAGLLVLVLAALGWLIWSWWGADAERPLLEEMARISAAGEPIYPEDFDPEPVADEDNAYLAIMDAAEALAMTSGLKLTDRSVPFDVDKAGEFVRANQEALALARKARGMTGCDSGFRLRTPVFASFPADWPNLKPFRDVAKAIYVAAKYHHQTGNDFEAAELLRDAVRIGRFAESDGIVINHLVAIAVDALACSYIEEICFSLKAADSPRASGPASRRQVEELIAELLDEDELRRATVRCYQGERACNADGVLCMLRGEPGASGGGGLLTGMLRPAWKRDALRAIRAYSATIEAVAQDNWPAASARLPEPSAQRGWLAKFRNPISQGMIPMFGRAIATYYRVLAMRRMAAIALAIRLYETDRGARPGELAELVGEYLPAIPVDPFAADGRVISYLPDAARPILYSIGPNGIDDGGRYADDPEGWVGHKYDWPFFLDGDRPPGEADTQPATSTGPAERSLPHE